MLVRAIVITLFAAFCAPSAISEVIKEEATAAHQEERFRAIAAEVRCLVCQNQTVLDSNAGLAGDLRRELRRLIAENRTNDEIKQFLVDRYGDFVLYKPPFKATTAALWLGPIGLILVGIFIVILIVRHADTQVESNQYAQEKVER